MQAKIEYQFSGKVWRDSPNGGWYFVSLPKMMSKEIRNSLQWQEEGWGRMKAIAKINEVEWNTSIWFDKKNETYLLPLKADIRKKAQLTLDLKIDVSIKV
ncbi:DUF1905 domain-containing protein [uncultured Tenacibaculum sp.]|uniref:DUF1905 domain-containing protein n=1 Tax=uncultured Tenacibaculum sp. TaxID=174713 RepID=UPI0026139670|nr:DUF1905 domain-containing protein [uncultured Tenacibaculum sp.]